MGSPVGNIPTVPPAIRLPATDNTLTDISGQLGNPAQDPTVAGVTSQLATAGAQPFVPNLLGLSRILAIPGSYTLHTFTAPARIWACILSIGAASSGAFNTGQINLYAQVKTQSGLVLGICEAALGCNLSTGLATQDSNGSNQNFNGVPIQTGDKIILDVNGGNNITSVVIRSSTSVLYSQP